MATQNQSGQESHPVLAPTEARQGRSGRPVLWVLLFSTMLVVIALAAVWAFHAPGLSGLGGQTGAPDQGRHAPRMQPSQSEPVPGTAPPRPKPMP